MGEESTYAATRRLHGGASSAYFALEARRGGLEARAQILIGELADADDEVIEAHLRGARGGLEAANTAYTAMCAMGEPGEKMKFDELTTIGVAATVSMRISQEASAQLDLLEALCGRLEWELEGLRDLVERARRARREAEGVVEGRVAEGWELAGAQRELQSIGVLLGRTEARVEEVALGRTVRALGEAERRAEALTSWADGLEEQLCALLDRRGQVEAALERALAEAERVVVDAEARGEQTPALTTHTQALRTALTGLSEAERAVEDLRVARSEQGLREAESVLELGEELSKRVTSASAGLGQIEAQLRQAAAVLPREIESCAQRLAQIEAYVSTCCGGRAWEPGALSEARSALERARTALAHGELSQVASALAAARKGGEVVVAGVSSSVQGAPRRLQWARWAVASAGEQLEMYRGLGGNEAAEVLRGARAALDHAVSSEERGDLLACGELAEQARRKAAQAMSLASQRAETQYVQWARGGGRR